MRFSASLNIILLSALLVMPFALNANAQDPASSPATTAATTPEPVTTEAAAAPEPVTTSAPLQSPGAEANFREGVIAFQKNDLKKARASFAAANAEASPSDNPSTLFNLGLVEQKDGHLGLAIALWRKALAARPDFEPAQRAITWSRGKLERAEIAHEVELWESFRNAALVTVPLARYLLTTAFLLFTSGWLLLRYFGRRRTSRLEEKPMPGFPTIGALASILFFATLILSVAKAYDQDTVRGTIVTNKVEARSSPDKTGTALFDLYEGLEVIVRQSAGEWVQVTYPGGSTGWIPNTSVLAVTDDLRKRATL